ncbi:GtrA family protein [Embleya sp. NPDC001921]
MFLVPVKRLRHLAPEVLRFAVVGLLGYTTDVGLFNVLRAVLDVPSLPAKSVSLSAATVVAYLGNHRWTYRDRTSADEHDDVAAARRRFLLFVGWSIGGLAIQLGCLALSHHVLGFDSLLADNISGNLIGMALATVFRFWGYRTWVFRASPYVASPLASPEAPPSRTTVARDVSGTAR